jgi:hypothetical protein
MLPNASKGALVARGTAVDPIVFTSDKAAPAPSDWMGLRFYQNTDAATTLLEHCRVDYAGDSYGAIYIRSASPSFKNITVLN